MTVGYSSPNYLTIILPYVIIRGKEKTMLQQNSIKLMKIVLGMMILVWGMTITQTQTQTQTQMLPQTTIALYSNAVRVDTKQIICMAKNIVYESGSESLHGQAAVARVVMNRVAHGFANNPCGVIYQKTTINERIICQFSWVCEGKDQINTHSERYKVAEQVAWDVMVNGKYKDVVPGSTLFFHAITVDPLWPYKKVATIGNHVFYSKAKNIRNLKLKEDEDNP